MSIRVILVDDHAILRAGLRRVLEAEPDIEVVGEAESADRAVFEALSSKPDVVVMDVVMPGKSGIEGMPAVLQAVPEAKVLVLSMQDDPHYVREAFEVGAAGYVLKEAADTEVVGAVRAVAAGERYVHPTLGARLVAAEAEERKRAEADPLSEREREVLRLLALGHTNQEIAKMLYISVRTAETHRAHIMQKLRLSSRAELVRYALENGLIEGRLGLPQAPAVAAAARSVLASADDEHVARSAPHDVRADRAEHQLAERVAAPPHDDEVGLELACGPDELGGRLADRLEVRRRHVPAKQSLARVVERRHRHRPIPARDADDGQRGAVARQVRRPVERALGRLGVVVADDDPACLGSHDAHRDDVGHRPASAQHPIALRGSTERDARRGHGEEGGPEAALFLTPGGRSDQWPMATFVATPACAAASSRNLPPSTASARISKPMPVRSSATPTTIPKTESCSAM